MLSRYLGDPYYERRNMSGWQVHEVAHPWLIGSWSLGLLIDSGFLTSWVISQLDGVSLIDHVADMFGALLAWYIRHPKGPSL